MPGRVCRPAVRPGIAERPSGFSLLIKYLKTPGGFRVERALEDVQKIGQTDTWQQLPAVKNGRVYVADGNAYFSSPGPRLIDGLEIMAHALHPQLHVRPPAGVCHIV